LILVCAEFAPRQQFTKSWQGGDNIFRFFFRRAQFIQLHNFQPAHEVQRVVGQQSWLCESNRDRKIRDDTVAIGFTRIAVETGRKIDSKHVGTLVCPQLIDATAGRANRDRAAAGFAPSPSKPSRIISGAAVPTYASAAIAS
jgi:hypothetical protein